MQVSMSSNTHTISVLNQSSGEVRVLDPDKTVDKRDFGRHLSPRRLRSAVLAVSLDAASACRGPASIEHAPNRNSLIANTVWRRRRRSVLRVALRLAAVGVARLAAEPATRRVHNKKEGV